MMELLTIPLAQQGASDGTITGLIVAFITAFGTIVALVVWLIKHIFQTTIPDLGKVFKESLEKVTAHCLQESTEERAATNVRFKELADANKETNHEILDLLRTLHQDSRDTVHALRNMDNSIRLRTRQADVLPSLDLPAWTKALDGTLMSFNQAAEKCLGWKQGELVGKSVYTRLIPPDKRREEEDILSQIAEGKTLDEYETERLKKDGTRITLILKTSPIRNQTGAVVGASTLAREA